MIRDVSSPAPAVPAARAQPAPPPDNAPPVQEAHALSPTFRVEAPLNMLVVEFRDSGGEVVHSIPSPRQLDAYRTGAADPPPALDLTG
jgi:hypothetical protein